MKELLDKLNEAYGAKKLRKAGYTELAYVAPEVWPKIQSDGMECLVELFAEELAKRDERIRDLEKYVKDGEAFDEINTRLDDIEGQVAG